MNNAVKNLDILAISLSVLHNYFDSSTITFLICIQLKFYIFLQNRLFHDSLKLY